MAWICVYRASGPADGFLARDWLLRSGIRADLRGDLSALRGEIPIPESWPSVWVPRVDADAARVALALMHAPRLVRDAWTCPKCGADGEPDFDTCWNCDADRPAEP